MNIVPTGQHLKLARLIYGYTTQEELAKVGGLNAVTIHRYENSNRVSPRALKLYKEVFHFDINSIMYMVEKCVIEREDLLKKLTET